MSLKAIAEETLARLRSGETCRETKKETEVKHVKQDAGSCFIERSVCFVSLKHDSRHITAESRDCFTVSFPRGGTDETSLPEGVAAGLQRLRSMPRPRGVDAAVWGVVVADALALAKQGWASQALALGWSELDLFGAGVDTAGDAAADGLAVRLRGRRMVAVSETFATIADPGGGRTWHYRRDTEGAVLLWKIRG